MDFATATDERLLRRRGRGAGDAFAELYRRHERPILAFFARRGWDAETVADLASTTFAEALRARHRFQDRGAGSAAAWLYGVAHRVHLRQARTDQAGERRARRLRDDHRRLSDAQTATISALTDDAPLLAALAELPAPQRDAVFAYVVADETYQEIAARAGVAEATVRQRVSRGLRALRAAQKESA